METERKYIEIGKYIGGKKIKNLKLSERKTYLGNEITEITYDDDTKEEFPKAILKDIITEEKSDLSTLRDKIIGPVVEKILAILLEDEIKIQDIEYLKAKLTLSINSHIENADTIVWGKEYYDRTLADIHQILIKNKKNEEKKSKERS